MPRTRPAPLTLEDVDEVLSNDIQISSGATGERRRATLSYNPRRELFTLREFHSSADGAWALVSERRFLEKYSAVDQFNDVTGRGS